MVARGGETMSFNNCCAISVLFASVLGVSWSTCSAQTGEVEFQGPGVIQLPSTRFVPASYEESEPPITGWVFSDASGNWRVSVRCGEDEHVVTLVFVEVISWSVSWARYELDGLSDVVINGDTVSFYGVTVGQHQPRIGESITLIGSLTRPSMSTEVSTWGGVKALYAGG